MFAGTCFVHQKIKYIAVDSELTEKLFSAIIVFEVLIQSKTLFIIPTYAHNYKIIGMLKTIKIPTIAPTCFGSRRNHHQGAISCLAKTTIMILLCSSSMTWSVLWRHTSLLCKHAVHGRGRHCSATYSTVYTACKSTLQHHNSHNRTENDRQ